MFTYAIIYTDDTIDVCQSDERLAYEAISAAVDGWIEGVALEGVTAYVNEEGKLRGLPTNKIATTISHEDNAIMPTDFICGNMIVMGEVDEDGEVTSLPEDFIPRVMNRLGVDIEGDMK
jgi:hypothetical protein